jgi:antitoxin FitA
MGVLVQIRDVPEETHRILKARAALQGVSLSEYLRGMLTRAASRPTPEELAARIASRGPVTLPEAPEVTIRRLRELGE